MVLINFLVSLSGFKAFDFTRSYVSLIYSTIKDSLIFLIIYLYSVIALAILYNITVDREKKSSIFFMSPYELNLYSLTNNENMLEYLYFIMASLINIIFMLNILIIVIGDGYNKFIYNNSENNYSVLSNIILEIENFIFCKRGKKEKKYLQVCDKYLKGSKSHEWKGKVRAITSAIELNHAEDNENFYKIQQQFDKISSFKENYERIMEKLKKIAPNK